MKTYNYLEAIAFLKKNYRDERLEAALDYLEWSDAQAGELLSPEEVEQGLFPVWPEQDLRDMAEEND